MYYSPFSTFLLWNKNDSHRHLLLLQGSERFNANNNVQNNLRLKVGLHINIIMHWHYFTRYWNFLSVLFVSQCAWLLNPNMTPELFLAVIHFLHTRNLNSVWGKDAFFVPPGRNYKNFLMTVYAHSTCKFSNRKNDCGVTGYESLVLTS